MKSEKYWFDRVEKPIIGLAPMHGFTNSEFRLKCKKAGADVVYSEMIASEAIVRSVPKTFEMMEFGDKERPYIVQIFGNSAETMAKAAKIVEKQIKPDGIDVNFGCPVQKAAKQQFGSYQLRDPQKAAEIVRAVAGATNLPVSVKMRLPSKIEGEIVEFVKLMFRSGAELVIIHARTATQKYGGHADWELLHKVKRHFPNKFILGSGDICTLQDLKDKLGNLDGALVGRAAKRDPEIFKELKSLKNSEVRRGL